MPRHRHQEFIHFLNRIEAVVRYAPFLNKRVRGGFHRRTFGGPSAAGMTSDVRAVDCKRLSEWQRPFPQAWNICSDLRQLSPCRAATNGVHAATNGVHYV
jgi:hypothetical protein